jgi:hypothetical protein
MSKEDYTSAYPLPYSMLIDNPLQLIWTPPVPGTYKVAKVILINQDGSYIYLVSGPLIVDDKMNITAISD